MTKRAKIATEILNEIDMATVAALDIGLVTEINETVVENFDDTKNTIANAVEIAKEVRDLRDILAEITDDDRNKMVIAMHASFDERAAFELTANPSNSNIQDTLRKSRTRFVTPGIAGLMIATETQPSVFNRSISEGKRFNVYAIDKMADLLHGLNSGHFKNAVNIAVMRSLFKFRAAGVAFTGLAATAAASDKVQVDKQMKALLVRHTMSASTAPTQSSSTMTALQALGVVSNRGTQKHPLWDLTDKPVTKALEKVFA